MKKTSLKLLSMIMVLAMMFSTTVAFAADGDVYLLADNSKLYTSNQARTDVTARNRVRTDAPALGFELNGKVYRLVDANAAFQIDEANFETVLQNNYTPVTDMTGDLEVVSVSAINTTVVEVEFAALAEAKTDVTVEVKDSADVVREVVAQDLAAGATAAQFDFVTPVLPADLDGVWTVNGVEYSFDELALVADIVTEAAAPVNQVELFNLLTQAGIENLNADLIADYATKIDTAVPAPVWAMDVQALIDEVNEDEMDDVAEAAVVKAVVDATTQIQLNAALQANFDRVNTAFIADYATENVATQGGMLALAGPANYFGTPTTGVDMSDIQAAIDSANTTAITNADTAAATAAEQAAVTVLIQNWVENDDPATPLLTPKADAIEASNINRLGFVVAEATTQNSLYNALVAYANATDDTVLKASELNANLKAEYLVELNTGTVRANAVTGFTGDSSVPGTTYDYKTNVVQAADLTALNAALADIDGLDNTNTPAEVKAALQELADVTAHKTGAAKFDMGTVIDSQLMNYVNLAANGFDAATINSIALVNTAITEVNDNIEEAANLDKIENSASVAEVRAALLNLALANSNATTDAFANAPAQAQREAAQLIMDNRGSLADPLTVGSITNNASGSYATEAIGKALADHALEIAKFNAIGDLGTNPTTLVTKGHLDTYAYAPYVALSNTNKLAVANAINALEKDVAGTMTLLDFSGVDAVETLQEANDIIDAAIAGL